MSLSVITNQKRPGTFIISLIGSVDSNTYMILEKEVDITLKSCPEVIILDMDRVNYMSSAGLRVIFKTKKNLKQNQGNLYVINLSPQIKKVFDIVNALPVQEVFSSIEELDVYLDKMQKKTINE